MKLFHLTLLVTVCAPLIFAAEMRSAEPARNAANGADANSPKPKITISKETTYITEPLRPDGYPDYVAALNQRMSQGVTPENNAAVLLIQALGPGIISDNNRAKSLKQLGIDDLPDKGDYIVPPPEMVRCWRARQPADTAVSEEALKNQFLEACRRPWSAEEFPIVAEWLTVNQKPFAIVLRAIDRPKYYFPHITYDDEYPPVISMLLPLTEGIPPLKFSLKIRAMQQIKLRNVDGAWKDSMTAHRLAQTHCAWCLSRRSTSGNRHRWNG